MQNNAGKVITENYAKMLKHNIKMREEEEIYVRKENAERMWNIKNDLMRKIEGKHAAERSLQFLKLSNMRTFSEEEGKMQKELEVTYNVFHLKNWPI